MIVTKHTKFREFLRSGSVWLLSFALTSAAFANPELSNVAHGDVSIQQSATTTTINQASQKAIINWNSYNIGSNESVHYQQPAGGVALNRISPTQGASQIYGRLTATGQVILVNPAGIFIGPNAFINVGSLIASTAGISDQNFLSGNFKFDQASPFAGAIINKGTIIAAQHGLIALTGNAVSNEGYIQANVGKVVLASGEAFTMSFAGNDLISFVIDKATTQRGIDANGNVLADGVKNTGQIVADGGTIMIHANAAEDVLDNAINLDGVVEAKAFAGYKGQIILASDQAGVVRLKGLIDASAPKGSNSKGGTVKITGKKIIVEAPAKIDVSGDKGGGTVNIGGDYLGQGPLPTSDMVVLAPGITIEADAIEDGDGGQVIVWSDNYTYASGNISVQGGATSGNGGFVETSSKDNLQIAGITVNTMAAHGETGTWLLDPADLTICTACTTDASSTTNLYNLIYGGNYDQFAAGATNSNLLVTDLTSQLATSNVVLLTSSSGSGGNGDIIIATPISYNSPNTLTLSAYRNISSSLDGTIITNANATGIVKLIADNTGTGFGTVAFTGTSPTISVGASAIVQTYYNPTVFGTQDTLFSVSGGFGYQYMLVNSLGNEDDAATVSSLGALSNPDNSALWTNSHDYALANDIDASDTINWYSGLGWSPIGNSTNAYNTDFDGLGHTISNLYINRPGENNLGLFGYINNSLIANLNVNGTVLGGQNNVALAVGYMADIFNRVNNVHASGSITLNSNNNNFIGGVIGLADTFGIQNGYIANSSSAVDITINGDGAEYIGGFAGRTREGNDISNSFNTGNVTINGSGGSAIGGLTGGNEATIESSYNTGNVTVGSNITNIGGVAGYNEGALTINSYNTGLVIGGSGATNVGGLVGQDYNSTVTSSYNTGDVYGEDSVGGLVGYYRTSGATITNSYNTGNVTGIYNVGGLVGDQFAADIYRSYNTGNVTGIYYVGGLVGTSFGATRDSYSIGNVSGIDSVGGFVGYSVAGSLEYNYSSGHVTGTTNVGGFGGQYDGSASITGLLYDIDTSGQPYDAEAVGGHFGSGPNDLSLLATYTAAGWNTIAGSTYGSISNTVLTGSTAPNFRWFIFEGQTRPMLMMEYTTNISNANQLQLVGTTLGADYSLTNNIDLTSGMTNAADIWGTNRNTNTGGGFVPIGSLGTPYTGYFDGDSYAITNLYINRDSSYQGLFASLGATAEIYNLNISGTINITDAAGFTGMLAGHTTAGSTIDNVHSSGDINIHFTQNTDYSDYGGLIGSNNSTISNSSSYTNLNFTADNNAEFSNIGGLVGAHNAGTITTSYSAGNITIDPLVSFNVGGFVGYNNANISNAYSIGTVKVSGYGTNIGGFVGRHDSGAISNAYTTSPVYVTYNTSWNTVGSFAGLISAGATIAGSFYDIGIVDGWTGAKGFGTNNSTALTGRMLLGGCFTGTTCNQETPTNASSATVYNLTTLQTYVDSGWTITATPETDNTAPSQTWFIFADNTRPLLMAEYSTNITNAHQLQLAGTTLGASYTLANNIDLANGMTNASDVWGTNSNDDIGAGFKPIGTFSIPFTGTFDGQNYQILNFYINRPTENDIGLFGVTNNNSVIENVGITAAIHGSTFVGGLIGRAINSTVDNVYSNINITIGDSGGSTGGLIGLVATSDISRAYSTGNITAGNSVSGVGGLISDFNSGTVSNAYSTVNIITGNNSDTIGGFAGGSFGTVTNAYSIGSVATGTGSEYIGGFAGQFDAGAITNSYSTGTVTATGINTSGGFIGQIFGGTLTGNFWDSVTSNMTAGFGVNTGGALASNALNGGCFGSTSCGTLSNASNATTTGVNLALLTTYTAQGWTDGSVITNIASETNTAPTASWFIFDDYTRPILMSEYSTTITNAHQLQLMGTTTGANYTLANNIDMNAGMTNAADIWGTNRNTSTGTGFATIDGDFTGMLAGQNYTISNLYMNRPDNSIGLFFYTTNTSLIQNLNLHGDVTGASSSALLAGYSGGIIDNVHTSGSFTLDTTGEHEDIGGIVSNNQGMIINTSNAATITINTAEYIENVGGLAGHNNGTILNSYNTGNIIINAEAGQDIGGLVGNTGEHTIARSYNTGNITVNAVANYVGGIAGRAFVDNTFSSIHNTGNITASTSNNVGGLLGYGDTASNITYSYNTGTISGDTSVGGLAGNIFDTTIQYSYNTGNVSGIDNVGGMIGLSDNSNVSASYNAGNVTGSMNVGGFLGQSLEALFDDYSNNYSIGNVTGTDYVGGFVGSNGSDTFGGTNIEYSYSTGRVTATGSNVGGFAGFSIGEVPTPGNYFDTVTSTQSSDPIATAGQFGAGAGANLTDSSVVYTPAGWNISTTSFNSTWIILEDQTRPMLSWEFNRNIKTAHGLQLAAVSAALDYNLTLANDIDLSAITNPNDIWGTSTTNGNRGWIPIGTSVIPYTDATFDGQNYTVTNLYINNPAGFNNGLFGYTDGATLQNINIHGTVTGLGNTGLLAGQLTLSSTVTNAHSSGSVTGGADEQIGGLIGFVYQSAISYSSNAASVTVNATVGRVGGLAGGGADTDISFSYNTGNIIVTGTGSGEIGGLIGNTNGTISNSYNTGNITVGDTTGQIGGLAGDANDAKISNSYNTGNITTGASATNVGGIAGEKRTSGNIDRVYNSGNITIGNSSTWIGGIAGFGEWGTFSDMYNLGSITAGTSSNSVGGIVGLSGDGNSIVRTYSTGAITTGTGSSNVGALVGLLSGGDIANSVWDTVTSGMSAGCGSSATCFGGATAGQFGTGSGVNLATKAAYTGVSWTNDTVISNTVSYNGAAPSATWFIFEGNTRPMLMMEYATTITNAHQLQLAGAVNTSNYTLEADIDLASHMSNAADIWGTNRDTGTGTGWHRVFDRLVGHFDGNNHTISNVYINEESPYLSPFGFLSDGSVKNVGIINPDITGTNYISGLLSGAGDGGLTDMTVIDHVYVSGGTITGMFNIGGLISFFEDGGVTLSNSWSSADVTGTSSVGGLIGNTDYGNFIISNSYATGNVTGNYFYVGGLIGRLWPDDDAYIGPSIVENSYATGNVTNLSTNPAHVGTGGLIGYIDDENNYSGYDVILNNVYASGNVSGHTGIGGLIGFIEQEGTGSSNSNTLTNAYATGNVTGTDYVGGLIGWIDTGQEVNVSNTYASGLVTGDTNVGGFIGGNNSANTTISNSFWDTVTSNQTDGFGSNAGAGTLNITAGQFGTGTGVNLSLLATYDPEWSISNTPSTTAVAPTATWFIFEGDTRPMLMMEYSTTIKNAHQLQLAGTTLGADYTLANDIDLNPGMTNAAEVWGTNTTSTGRGFSVIGVSTNPFTGSLDGNNNVIFNLYINRSAQGTGLFGYISNSSITNLGIADVDITSSQSYIGSLVGYAINPTIANVFATGNINSSSNVSSLGGLIGFITDSTSSSITNAYSGVDIDAASGTLIGGIVGSVYNSDFTLSDAYNTGSLTGNNMVGGLVGYASTSDFTVSTSYNSGAVSAATSNLGGVLGGQFNNTTFDFNDVFWDTETSLTDNAYNFGALSSVTGIITANALLKDTYTNWSISNTIQTGSTAPTSTWFIFEGNTRPMLMMEYNTNIRNAHQLQLAGTTLGADYTLANDVDLANTGTNAADVWGTSTTNDGFGFVPIGDFNNPFTGDLNGQSYTISNLYIDRPTTSRVGIFGQITNNTISNIYITDANVTGGSRTGILAGAAGGSASITNLLTTVDNVHTSGTVFSDGDRIGSLIGSSFGDFDTLSNIVLISNSSNSANITGDFRVGGLVGLSSNTEITNSYNTGTIDSIENQLFIGGIVGWMQWNSVVNNSYNTGNVSGISYIGGIAGSNNDGTVTNSYNAGNVTGTTNFAGGIVGFHAAVDEISDVDTIIRNTYNIGTVTGMNYVGGVVGYDSEDNTVANVNYLENSYNSGIVIGTGTNVGGFAGFSDGSNRNYNFWDTATSGITDATQGCGNTASCTGVIAGTFDNSGGADLSALLTYTSNGWTSGTVITSTVETDNTAPTSTWFIFDGSTRPMLMMEYATTITNAHQLQLAGTTLGADYTLANDIDLTATMTNKADVWGTDTNDIGNTGAGWAPIGSPFGGSFNGSFDGQSNLISNLYIYRPTGNAQGLFGLANDNATIVNLGVNGNVTGEYDLGILLGYGNTSAASRITNVYTTGEIHASTANRYRIGGLIGYYQLGEISNSYSQVSISAPNSDMYLIGGLIGATFTATISNSYSSGSITTGSNAHEIGGLIGDSDATILNSFSSSNITIGGAGVGTNIGGLVGNNNSSIQSSYSTGAITISNGASQFIGGLAGNNYHEIINSYSTSSVTVGDTADFVGGLAGLSDGDIINAYSTGLVTTGSTPGDNIGGFIGYNDNSSTITASFWDTDTSAQSIGIGIDDATGSELTGGCFTGTCTNGGTANLSSIDTYTTDLGVNAWDMTDTWGIVDGLSYPYLRTFYTNPRIISGTSDVGSATVNIVADGNLLTSFNISGTSFNYFAAVNNISGLGTEIADGANLLLYVNDNAIKSNAVALAPDANGSLVITLNQNAISYTIPASTTTIDNTLLGGAHYASDPGDVLYNVSGTDLTINSPYSLLINTGSENITYSGNYLGTGSLTKQGSGTLTVTGANTFSGNINIEAGIYNVNTGSGTTTVTNVLAGTGTLAKSGTGTLFLTGNNSSYNGTIRLDAGTLSVNAATQVGSGASNITFNGGTLTLDGTFSLLPALNINTDGVISVSSGTINSSGAYTGSNQLTKSGAGTLSLTGSNTGYTGQYNISAGTLSVNNANNIGNAALIQLSGGTLRTNNSLTLGTPLSVTGASIINVNAGTLNIASTINGSSSLTINGSGAGVTLSGLIGGTTPLGALTSNMATTIANDITTAGNQTYNAAVSLGNHVALAMTGTGTNVISMNNGVNGNLNLTLNGSGSGTYQYVLGGTLVLNNVEVNGSIDSISNKLTLNNSNKLIWNISGDNTGNVTNVNGVAGTFNYTRIYNITGGTAGNDFIFGNNAKMTGVIDAVSTAFNNLLSFAAYTTPVNVTFSSAFNGSTRNNASALIADFRNFKNFISGSGVTNSSITTLPSTTSTVTVTAPLIASLNNNIAFSNFQKVLGIGVSDKVVFNVDVVYNVSTGVATFNNNDTMTFTNMSLTSDAVNQAKSETSAVQKSTEQEDKTNIAAITDAVSQTNNNVNDIVSDSGNAAQKALDSTEVGTGAMCASFATGATAAPQRDRNLQ